jgi:hypothetical protein
MQMLGLVALVGGAGADEALERCAHVGGVEITAESVQPHMTVSK